MPSYSPYSRNAYLATQPMSMALTGLGPAATTNLARMGNYHYPTGYRNDYYGQGCGSGYGSGYGCQGCCYGCTGGGLGCW